MNRFAALMLAFVLSGAVAVAGTLSMCPPMPCCIGAQAKMDESSPNCCVITKASTEQPRNTTSKIAVDPNLLAFSFTHVQAAPAEFVLSAERALPSSPPTVHQRLATLSILLI
jgi:hypothetical protein